MALWTGTPGHPAEGFLNKTLETALYYAASCPSPFDSCLLEAMFTPAENVQEGLSQDLLKGGPGDQKVSNPLSLP